MSETYECSKNERAFLDEIREKGVYEPEHEVDHDNPIGSKIKIPACISIGDGKDGSESLLQQGHFTKSNLKDLVNDTKTKAD